MFLLGYNDEVCAHFFVISTSILCFFFFLLHLGNSSIFFFFFIIRMLFKSKFGLECWSFCFLLVLFYQLWIDGLVVGSGFNCSCCCLLVMVVMMMRRRHELGFCLFFICVFWRWYFVRRFLCENQQQCSSVSKTSSSTNKYNMIRWIINCLSRVRLNTLFNELDDQ